MNKDKSLSKVRRLQLESGLIQGYTKATFSENFSVTQTVDEFYNKTFISEMREIRGLLLRPRRASRESLPPNPVSDTL